MSGGATPSGLVARGDFIRQVAESFDAHSGLAIHHIWETTARETSPLSFFLPVATYQGLLDAAGALYDFLAAKEHPATLVIRPWPGTEKTPAAGAGTGAGAPAGAGAGAGSSTRPPRIIGRGRAHLNGGLLTTDYPPDPLELSLEQATRYAPDVRPDGQEIELIFDLKTHDLTTIRHLLLEIWQVLQTSTHLGYCLNSSDSCSHLPVLLDHPSNPKLGLSDLPITSLHQIPSPFILLKKTPGMDVHSVIKQLSFSLQELLAHEISPALFMSLAQRRSQYEQNRLENFLNKICTLRTASAETDPYSKIQAGLEALWGPSWIKQLQDKAHGSKPPETAARELPLKIRPEIFTPFEAHNPDVLTKAIAGAKNRLEKCGPLAPKLMSADLGLEQYSVGGVPSVFGDFLGIAPQYTATAQRIPAPDRHEETLAQFYSEEDKALERKTLAHVIKALFSYDSEAPQDSFALRYPARLQILAVQLDQAHRDYLKWSAHQKDPQLITDHVFSLMKALAAARVLTPFGAGARRLASFIPGVESIAHFGVLRAKSECFRKFLEALQPSSTSSISSISLDALFQSCRSEYLKIFTAAAYLSLQYKRRPKDDKPPTSLAAALLLDALTKTPVTPRADADRPIARPMTTTAGK